MVQSPQSGGEDGWNKFFGSYVEFISKPEVEGQSIEIVVVVAVVVVISIRDFCILKKIFGIAK